METSETRIITTPRAIGPVYAFVAAIPAFAAFTPILWWETPLSSSSAIALVAKLLIATAFLSIGVRLSNHYIAQAFVISRVDEILQHATIWFALMSVFGMRLLVDIPYSIGGITFIIAFRVLAYIYPLAPEAVHEAK